LGWRRGGNIISTKTSYINETIDVASAIVIITLNIDMLSTTSALDNSDASTNHCNNTTGFATEIIRITPIILELLVTVALALAIVITLMIPLARQTLVAPLSQTLLGPRSFVAPQALPTRLYVAVGSVVGLDV